MSAKDRGWEMTGATNSSSSSSRCGVQWEEAAEEESGDRSDGKCVSGRAGEVSEVSKGGGGNDSLGEQEKASIGVPKGTAEADKGRQLKKKTFLLQGLSNPAKIVVLEY